MARSPMRAPGIFYSEGLSLLRMSRFSASIGSDCEPLRGRKWLNGTSQNRNRPWCPYQNMHQCKPRVDFKAYFQYCNHAPPRRLLGMCCNVNPWFTFRQ